MPDERMMPNIIKIILTVALFTFNSCTTAQKLYPLPEQGVTVMGNKIYDNGKVFAELRVLLTNKEFHSHRGLAIYYYPYDKEVWIFPESGWHYFDRGEKHTSLKDIEQAWKSRKNDDIIFYEGGRRAHTIKIHKTCFDVRMSDDGKYVYYKTRGFFFDSSHRYMVEYGISK